MNRFRTFAGADTTDFSQLYQQKKGNTLLKFARSHTPSYNNAYNKSFFMKNNVSVIVHHEYDRHDSDSDDENNDDHIEKICIKSIVNYNDYSTLINLSKTANRLDPNCKTCADIPINIKLFFTYTYCTFVPYLILRLYLIL